MNRRKFLSILTMVALIVTMVVPALGASGDGEGSAKWPANINISESTLETSSYQLGDVKEFSIGYYPANMTGAVIEADRHIEITGPEEVTSFQFSEDKGNTWQPIDKFEGNIKITTTTEHKVRAAFHEEGEYTIRLWMTDDEGVVVKESVKNIYVSEEGIYVRPNAPAELKETENKLVFQWQYNANKTVKYNFYIDGEKVNTEAISEKMYDASAYADRFTPGTHYVSVSSVLVKNNTLLEKVESAPITMEYKVEETTTNPEITTTDETTTTEESTTNPETTTEDLPTNQETTTEENVTNPETTTVGEATTDSETTTAVEPTTKGETTTKVPSTATAKPTTKAPASGKLKLAKGKVIKASKKATAKKVKITFKKIKKAKFYEVQICRDKKFRKKNTIKKTVKKTNCTFKKLKARKRYYVRVRAGAKVNGKKVFGKWSSKKRVQLKK